MDEKLKGYGYDEKQIWALEELDKLAEKLGSQNKACIQVGINAGVISRIKSGTYSGDIEKQFSKIIEYFEVKTENAKVYKSNEYLPTSVSTQVYNYLRRCQIKGRLMALSGDAGIGKTQAIKKYVTDNHTSSVRVTATESTSAVTSFLRMLCMELGIVVTTRFAMELELKRKLKDGMIIIVDEAQHLHMKTIDNLRQLSDYFEDNGMTLGVAFVGNATTINKFGSNVNANFAQIENRTLQKPVFSTKDILKTDIHLMFPQLENDEMAIDFMLGVARSRQGIRGAKNLFSEAYDNNNITYDGLVAMAKHMNLVL